MPRLSRIKYCDIVKKNMKQLCEYGVHGELREFSFFNIHNDKQTVLLRENDKLHPKKHCTRCEVRVVIRSSDPHNVVECPSCGYQITYNETPIHEQIKTLENQLFKLIENINDIKDLLVTMERKNYVVEKNLKNKAMEPEEKL